MSWTAFSRTLISVLLVAGCATPPATRTLLYADDFTSSENWSVEAEQPAARVEAGDGALDIDTPAGLTLWFRPRLTGPVEIEFEATAVAAGGPNDQVSDLNVFWMATNRDGSEPATARRSGRFEDYNDLLTYYVGLGGNRNTTTRFRRYIGDPARRPLLAEHDPFDPGCPAGRQPLAAHHAGGERNPCRVPPGWPDSVLLGGPGALHRRLVRASDHEKPPANPAPADLFTVRPSRRPHPRLFPLFRVEAVGVGVYNSRPLAKAP
jgi:hypothetical protein